MQAALMLGLLPAATAAGEAWQLVHEDAAMSVSIDKASLDRQGQTVSFREREILLQPRMDPASLRRMQEIRYRRNADCAGRRLSVLSRAVFSDQGTLMAYESTRPHAVIWDMPQSDRDFKVLEAVCGPA